MLNSNNSAIYVKYLSLENVRCFGPIQELDFTNKKNGIARWTLILGENGVGKTTLLQSLVRMQPIFNLPSDDTAEKESPLEPPPVVPELASEEKNDVLKAFARHNTRAKIESHFTYGELLDSSQHVSDGRILKTMFEIELDSQNEIEKVNFSGFPEHYVDYEEPLVLAYGAGRFPVSSKLSDSDERSSTQPRFEDITRIPDVKSRLYELDYNSAKNLGNAKKNLDRLKSMLANALPDIDCPESIDIRGLYDSSSSQGGIYVNTPYGVVPFDQLSMGYRTVFSWIVDIAWNLLDRFNDSQDPFLEPAIVLVDEIDLHLHPQWQRQIRLDLTRCFPNIQFIATSHSPFMALDSLDSNLVLVRRNEDYTVIETEIETNKEWRLDQLVSSQWFGFQAVRHLDVDRDMQRLRVLSQKESLTPDEQNELENLDDWLKRLPTAELWSDQKLMETIRKFAEQLESK